MAYEINFCETQEQLKHLGEVVTGKADGSPIGADIETSTLAYTGQVRETLSALLAKLGWYSVGEWSTDPLISNDNQYVLYNGIRYVPLSTPYQVNSAANPDPEFLVGTELKVITDVTDEDITTAQNDIIGGSIFKGSNGEYVQNGDVVPVGTTHLRVLAGGEPKIVRMGALLDGLASGLTESSVTIGGTTTTLHEFLNGGYQATNAELLVITPAIGELWFNTTDNSIHMGDGATLGGNKFRPDNASSTLNVKHFGAKGDGVTDDTFTIQTAIDAAINKRLEFPDGEYLISSGLNFNGWTGEVIGTGVIQCKPGVSIPRVLDFSNAVKMTWSGVQISMGQSDSTLESDLRTDNCFYFYNSRSCRVSNVTITNVRIGEPIYVDGSSSVSPSASDGSKRIFFDNIQCVADSYPVVDLGAAVIIRSDFYTSDNGGIYHSSSNGTRVDNLTVDDSVAFKQTTSDIYFNNCRFSNFDRIGYLNVRDIHMTGVSLENFNTRGHSLSPTCENVTVTGGVISGDAAQINANFGCRNCTFSNLAAEGADTSTGQRHSLRAGYGSSDIVFSNIVGIGNDQFLAYIEGASNISFDNVNLDNWQGGNTVCSIGVNTPTGATGYEVKNINFTNCNFSSNYCFQIQQGDGSVAQRAVRLVNCDFTRTIQMFNVLNTNGEIEWVSCSASEVRNDSMDSRAFSIYEGGNVGMVMKDQYICDGTTSDQFPTFSSVYYPTTYSNQGDSARLIPLVVYYRKSSENLFYPLVYGEDWFIDNTMASEGMVNRIRLAKWNETGLFETGDVVQIQRLN